jgi:NTP pyrophosphatase (non-canonical NTP hydrolase)
MPTLKNIDKKIRDFSPKEDHPTYWGCALAGEAGEVANLLKKLERDGLVKTVDSITGQTAAEKPIDNEIVYWSKRVFAERLGEELADTLIYLLLIARRFPDINLETAVLDKIKEINKKRSDQQA